MLSVTSFNVITNNTFLCNLSHLPHLPCRFFNEKLPIMTYQCKSPWNDQQRSRNRMELYTLNLEHNDL